MNKTTNVSLYEYNGIVGTPNELAQIYRVSEKGMIEALNSADKKTAIDNLIRKERNSNHKPDHRSNPNRYQALTPEQKQYVEDNLQLVNKFIATRKITNPDIQQELYMSFIKHISTRSMNDKRFRINMKAYAIIKHKYIQIMQRHIDEAYVMVDANAFPETRIQQYIVQQTNNQLWDKFNQRQMRSNLMTAIKTLSPQAQIAIEYRYGFIDGQCHQYDEITQQIKHKRDSGTTVSRERVRQITKKAILKLQKPPRIKYYEIYK